MNSIELTAPAKVNLVLRVLNKRKDSYHNLVTLFERISIHDRIIITRIPKGILVTCDRAVTPRPQDNIAYKAAELILKAAGIESGVKIRIVKRIPIAAGLGGGSSDAAAVLVGINKLFRLGMNKRKLMRLGASLGADVPFFIFDSPFAIGRGIGDRLKRVNIGSKLHHLLICPGFKVATKGIYQSLDASKLNNGSWSDSRIVKGLKGLTHRQRLTNIRGGVRMTLPSGLKGPKDLLHNDLEDVAVSKRPVLGRIIRCLVSSLDVRAMVSGSGPSLFCLYRTRREAKEAKKRLYRSVPKRLRRLWQVFIVETEC